MEYVHKIKDERPKFQEHETLDEYAMDDDDPFYELLTGEDEGDAAPAAFAADDGEEYNRRLFQVSLEDGEIKLDQVKEEPDEISRDDFDSSGVFVLDCGDSCIVWVGGDVEVKAEMKKNGMAIAHNHLMKTGHPLIPITIVREDQSSSEFEAAIAA
jgi:gelsolin